MTKEIIIFAVLQLINVVVSTIKYVVTVKSRPSVAAIVNALSYTINAVITIFIVKQDMYIVIPVTFFNNLIGVPIGRLIVSFFEKEKLWVFNATVRCSEDEANQLRKKLKEEYLIHSTYEEISEGSLYSMRFFSYSKEDSRIVERELNKRKAKFYIVEAH